jgi:hypothetical protein
MANTITKRSLRNKGDPTILVGADPAGRMLEIVVAESEGIDVIIHAMPSHAMPARAELLEP